ncbi:MAG: hypothetical protein VW378_07960, partial [bacterium]
MPSSAASASFQSRSADPLVRVVDWEAASKCLDFVKSFPVKPDVKMNYKRLADNPRFISFTHLLKQDGPLKKEDRYIVVDRQSFVDAFRGLTIMRDSDLKRDLAQFQDTLESYSTALQDYQEFFFQVLKKVNDAFAVLKSRIE